MAASTRNRWTLVGWGGIALWGTLAAFLTGVTIASILVARNARHDQVLAIGLQTAISLGRVLRTAGPPAGPDRLRLILERFEAPGVLYVQLLDGHGGIISTGPASDVSAPSTPAVRLAIRSGDVVPVSAMALNGRSVHDVYVPFLRPGPGPRAERFMPPPPGDDEAEPVGRAWGFRPRESVVRVGVDASPAQWLDWWVWAQGLASLAAIVALGVLILRARRTGAVLAVLEDQRRRREVLARLGEVSAVLAHEIRNPLASLKGHAQLAAEHASKGAVSADEVASRLAVVVEETERVEALVSGLLDYARDRRLAPVPVVVLDLLHECVRRIDDVLGPCANLAAICPGDLIAPLDRDQVARAIVNLLLNAREAVGPEGRVRVHASVAGNDLVIEVEDDGPGVPDRVRERLFEPFVTGKVRGIGLGLAIVMQVVEAHGGTVDADRSPTLGGARFTARFPMTQPG